jgi:hypothetical protein
VIAASSTDGRYVLVIFETGEAIAYRDEIEKVLRDLSDKGKLGELGNALSTLLPIRLELVRKKARKKGKK